MSVVASSAAESDPKRRQAIAMSALRRQLAAVLPIASPFRMRMEITPITATLLTVASTMVGTRITAAMTAIRCGAILGLGIKHAWAFTEVA